MKIDNDQVTLTVEEFNHHLDFRGEGARDVGVACTAGLILVTNSLGWRWAPAILLAIALARIVHAWRKDKAHPQG